MAELKHNIILEGISGKFEGKYVFRQMNGKTFVSKRNKIRYIRTEAQDKQRKAFTEAVAYAKNAITDPNLMAIYEKKAIKMNKKPYHLAISDFMRTPNIDQVDMDGYHGKAGDTIDVYASSLVKITRITLSITNPKGILLESGEATCHNGGWQYHITADNPSPIGSRIAITAYDLPNHTSTVIIEL